MNPKVEMIFEIIINGLTFVAGCILLYFLYSFSQGMEALAEFDEIIRMNQ